MQALLMCGSVPDPKDPLYPYTRGGPKALLDVAGKPMAQWVLDALNGSTLVDGVIIIGLGPESGLIPKKPVAYLPDHGGAVPNAPKSCSPSSSRAAVCMGTSPGAGQIRQANRSCSGSRCGATMIR